jgi:hypothetical protein
MAELELSIDMSAPPEKRAPSEFTPSRVRLVGPEFLKLARICLTDESH